MVDFGIVVGSNALAGLIVGSFGLGPSVLMDWTARWAVTCALRRALTESESACGCAVGVFVKCPLAVASELGMCFLTKRDVSLGTWFSPDK